MKILTLTRRDRDLIRGVIGAQSNKEIAARLGISENTIKVYMTRLFAKLGVGSRLELAQWGRAYSEGRRRSVERYRKLHPESPEQPLEFKEMAIVEYAVLRAMALITDLNREQREEIALILLKGRS